MTEAGSRPEIRERPVTLQETGLVQETTLRQEPRAGERPETARPETMLAHRPEGERDQERRVREPVMRPEQGAARHPARVTLQEAILLQEAGLRRELQPQERPEAASLSPEPLGTDRPEAMLAHRPEGERGTVRALRPGRPRAVTEGDLAEMLAAPVRERRETLRAQ